ncbi:cytochrome b [Natronospira bacteriovora]|uniref:Cytochrome b n=1 Tax=Natronospira bacteriovora TaxID=3069753 RepID=A0ABU0W963_9GAMM|nr:cytochrome bc complex cytochrome b subunit [Natronospira sp. AB-CW4]MDQ2069525.1 cytochrome bc complex cytochrome b subunit [Natronospira sp. AB-CW4]
MQNKSNTGGGTVGDWINDRLPYREFVESQLTGYYAPKNFNFWYFFGSLALLVLVIQIVTGIFLTMSYKPSADGAFASVEYIMRDVEWGWLLRYMHSTGASMFFVVVYLHMFRGLMYGSYKKPRELLWIFGVLIYIVLMAEAFMGYLLPWGQMSYWGAQVIISLFGVLPYVGEPLATWIRGDYLISDVTLNRFFALHVIALPLVLIGLVFFHLVALRQTGSNNPDGIEIKQNLGSDGKPVDGIPFHPYYTVKDIFAVGVFLFLFALIVFYAPTFLDLFLKPANFVPADPLQTPDYVPPVWYFTPFYAILRAIPDQLGGVIAMGLAIVVLFFLPWIDRHPVKSVRYRSTLYKTLLMAFAGGFVVLGYLGLQPATPLYSELSLRFTQFYFLFFGISWVYSFDRSRNYYYGAFGIVAAIMILMDLLRDTGGMSLIALAMMLLVSAVFLLLPPHTRLNESKPVPERVTS